jgi:hypothetical protein
MLQQVHSQFHRSYSSLPPSIPQSAIPTVSTFAQQNRRQLAEEEALHRSDPLQQISREQATFGADGLKFWGAAGHGYDWHVANVIFIRF